MARRKLRRLHQNARRRRRHDHRADQRPLRPRRPHRRQGLHLSRRRRKQQRRIDRAGRGIPDLARCQERRNKTGDRGRKIDRDAERQPRCGRLLDDVLLRVGQGHELWPGNPASPGSAVPTTAPGDQDVNVPLANLEQGTTYHYRLVAINSFGTTTGNDQAFSTRSRLRSPRSTRPTSPPAAPI